MKVCVNKSLSLRPNNRLEIFEESSAAPSDERVDLRTALSEAPGPVLAGGLVLWENFHHFVATGNKLRTEKCLLLIDVLEIVLACLLNELLDLKSVVKSARLLHKLLKSEDYVRTAVPSKLAEGNLFKESLEVRQCKIVPAVELNSIVGR
jgi:hypothetical protein